jgi:hypothetical protein
MIYGGALAVEISMIKHGQQQKKLDGWMTG